MSGKRTKTNSERIRRLDGQDRSSPGTWHARAVKRVAGTGSPPFVRALTVAIGVIAAGRRYVGEGGKDGTYYLLNRTNLSLVWARNVVFGGSAGGFYGASFDGRRIFAATSLGDGNIAAQTGLCNPSDPRDTFLQEPSMHALAVQGGTILWERMHNHSVAPTSTANGVVFSGLIGIEGFGLNAYDAATGRLLVRLPMNGSVNSAATPVGKHLFVSAGTSVDGTGSGIFAFALPEMESDE